MANKQKTIRELYAKLTNVPDAGYDSQLAVMRIKNGEVHISSKALTHSSIISKENKENAEFAKMLLDAQSALVSRKGEAECIVEIDSGLIGFVENRGYMGGGMIMTLRDAYAPTLPNTLCASAGRVISDEEIKTGTAIRSIVSNAFAEVEFTFSYYNLGALSFRVHSLDLPGASAGEFSDVTRRGARILAEGKLKIPDHYDIISEGTAYPARFHGAPDIYELGERRAGAAFSIEPGTGSGDFIVPVVYENLFSKPPIIYSYDWPTYWSLSDIEVRGGELLTGSQSNLKSLDRQILYVYGNEAKVSVFQSGKIAFEADDFYEFMEKSGLKKSVMEGKTSGLTSQIRTVIFGNYEKIDSLGGNVRLSYKNGIKNSFLNLWKEAKREDLIEQAEVL